MYLCAVNFAFLSPLFGLFLYTEMGSAVNVLYKTAVSLVQARRETAGESTKVCLVSLVGIFAMSQTVDTVYLSPTNQYKDLLQLMIDACSDEDGTPEGGKKLTNKEIVANSITFLLAGYETTANALSYASYLLALNPTVQDRLHAEIEEYFQNNPVSNDGQ